MDERGKGYGRGDARFGRRWGSNPSGKCSYERPTRGTVCGTVRSMCGADAGCLAINYQSLQGSGGEDALGERANVLGLLVAPSDVVVVECFAAPPQPSLHTMLSLTHSRTHSLTH